MWNIPVYDYENVKLFCPQLEGMWREFTYTFIHSLTLPEPVWTFQEEGKFLARTGIQTSDCPVRSLGT
jgi:hypothetical protein